MSRRLAYHPSARIDAGHKPERAPRKSPCTWSTRGFDCGCDACNARLTSRQLDLMAEKASRALRGRI